MADGTIYLVRHGRTALNAAGVLRGRLDPPLDAVGLREAVVLGETFADVRIAAVVTSPLARARATSEPIAASTGAPLLADDAFADRDYGPWAGTARGAVEAEHGSVDAAPGVEPFVSFAARVVEGTTRYAARFDPLVIVGHDAVNRALLVELCVNITDDPEALGQRTGCWNRLERVRGQWLAAVIDAVPGDGQTP